MPRFAANLSLLFTELPFLDRFAAAARAGFKAVEFQFPYDYSLDELVQRQQLSHLPVVLFNLYAGDWTKGERGIACHPNRVDEFRTSLARSIQYAQGLACPRLNCLSGICPEGVSLATAHATLLDNLRFAADELAKAGLELLLEPINSRDIPGFLVDRPRQGLALLVEAQRPNLRLQYDVYHAQVMEGDLARTLANNLAHIGHIQIADNPGRHEPGTGEIAYPFLFKHLDAIGYQGWIGCEYNPAQGTEAGLAWLRSL